MPKISLYGTFGNVKYISIESLEIRIFFINVRTIEEVAVEAVQEKEPDIESPNYLETIDKKLDRVIEPLEADILE